MMSSHNDNVTRFRRMQRVALTATFSLVASLSEAQITAPSSQAAVKLTDARKAEDKQFSYLSRFVGSCNYGIIALGDEQAPGRIELLEARLREKLGGNLGGRVVTIERYEIYVNVQDSARRSAIVSSTAGLGGGFAAGTAAGLVASEQNSHTTGSHCPKEKMSGGWIGPSEVTTLYDPYIAEIDAVIDGNHVTARAVYSPTKWMGRCGGYSKKACYTSPAMVEAIAGVENGVGIVLADQLSGQLTQ